MDAERDIRSPGDARRFRASIGRDHLLVRDLHSGRVVAACLLHAPAAAAEGFAMERHFDLAMLDTLRSRTVELGAPCVDRGRRSAAIMHHLWTSLARYLVAHRFDHVLAAVEIPLEDGGHAAASAFREVSEASLSPVDLRAIPRARLPLESLRDCLQADWPQLLRAYVGLGAWACGEPALDADRATAIIPMLLPLARMRGRYARQFLARAA